MSEAFATWDDFHTFMETREGREWLDSHVSVTTVGLAEDGSNPLRTTGRAVGGSGDDRTSPRVGEPNTSGPKEGEA